MRLITFQDFEKEKDNADFLLTVMNDYKNWDMYKTAVEAQEYYRHDNRAIRERMTYLQRHGLVDAKVMFHKIRNGFFPKAVKQTSQYLLGNGATLPPEVKSILGPRFDKSLQQIGMQALVDGVNWGYWKRGAFTRYEATGETIAKPNQLKIFRATEFAPLYDEETGDTRAALVFQQIDPEKPLVIHFFTEQGIIKYISTDGKALTQAGEIVPYVINESSEWLKNREDESLDITDTDDQPTIPIVPFYANEMKVSEFNPAIKALIDADDFVMSDLIDGTTITEGVYWVLKNFGGADVAELLT